MLDALTGFGEISSEVKAVLITLLVTVFWTEYRELRVAKIKKKRIASVMFSEVLNQAAFVVHLGSVVNLLISKETWTTRAELARFMSSKPLVFEGLIAELPLLGTPLSGNVVTFYESLERARTYIAMFPEDIAIDPLATVRLSEVATAMRMASEIGQSIIRDLSEFADRREINNGIVNEILNGLDMVRRGGSPSLDGAPASA